VLVVACHALAVEGVFFEDGLEVVYCVCVHAHAEAEEACERDDGFKRGEGLGSVGGWAHGEDGGEVCPEDGGDEVDVVGEVGREGVGCCVGGGREDGADVGCVVGVAVEAWYCVSSLNVRCLGE